MYPITSVKGVAGFRTLYWLFLSLSVIIAGLLLTGCKSDQNATPTPLPTDVTFVSPVTSVPTIHISPVTPVSSDKRGLPEGAQQVGAQYSGDFDSDGQQELATGYKNSNGAGGGMIVYDILEAGYSPVWEEELPPDLTPSDFLMQDVESDGSPELLLFAENDGAVEQHLFIYTWTGSTYTRLKPTGGPLDGQSTFLSLYWLTMLDDVDSNGTTEIITFVENKSNPEALSAAVYEWNGSEFHYTDLYIIPPRFKPTGSN
jgi:hypothetical protein